MGTDQEQDDLAAPEPASPGQHRWIVGAVVAALLGLLLYLAVQYTGPSTVTDERLEAEAVEAVEAGRAAEAAARYAELAARATDARERASWLLEQASALVQAEQPDVAITVLREAAGLDVGDEDLRLRLALRLADLLVDQGQLDAAREAYRAIAAVPTTSPEYLAPALVGLLDVLTAAGDAEGGRTALHAALNAYPDNPESAVALSDRVVEILLARDRGVEAVAALEAMPGDSWPPRERSAWLLARARAADELRDFDGALALYDEALAAAGEDQEAVLPTRFEIASLRYRRGDLDVARDLLAALDVDGTPVELRGHVKLQRAEVLRRLGEVDEARALYHAVIDGWPTLEDAVSQAREGLGALLEGPEGDEALEGLFAALAAGGEGAAGASDVILGRGNALLERGRVEESLALFERLRAVPGLDDVTGLAADQGRAAALIQLDRNAEAIELLRSLPAGLAPEQRLVVDAQIGETLLRAGQLDEAEVAFNSLRALAAELGFRTAHADLGLAGVAEAREHHEQAIHLYRQVASAPVEEETRIAALQGLANLLLVLGRDEESMVAFRELEGLLAPDNPTSLTIRMSVADIYAARGDIARERALWRELLLSELSPEQRAQARIRLLEIDRSEAAEAGDRRRLEATLTAYKALRADATVPETQAPDVVFGLAACLYDLGRYEEAIAFVDESLAAGRAGADPGPFQTLREQAQAALRGDPLDPDLPPAADGGTSDEELARLVAEVARAGSLRDSGRYAEALARFQELAGRIEDPPTRATITREIAQTQVAMGDAAAARRTLEEGLAGQLDEEALFLAQLALADLDLREADADAAIARLTALTPPDPGLALWRLEALARAQSTRGDTATALKIWREAIELSEGDPDAAVVAWTGLGDLYLQVGEPVRASDAFQRAAVLAPEGPARDQSRLRAAQVLLDQGDLAAAAEILTDLEAEVGTPEGRIQVALTRSALHQERGEWQAGIDVFKGLDTSTAGPEYEAQIADARGVCLLAQGKTADARKAYADLAQRWPAHPEATAVSAFGLAAVQAAGGDLEGAAATCEGFVRGTTDRFRQGQALLRLGQLLEQHGAADRARKVYARVRDEYPDEPELAAAAAQGLGTE